VALSAIPMFDAAAQRHTAANVRRTALLACADGATHRSAARWLATAGFEVTAAGSVGEALEALAGETSPALVVTDLAASGEQGRALCTAARERPGTGSTPVLALCAARGEAEAAIAAGATELLRRPYDWHLATLRAERLVRLAEADAALAAARLEVAALRATATGPSMSMAAPLGGGLFAAMFTGVPGWHAALLLRGIGTTMFRHDGA